MKGTSARQRIGAVRKSIGGRLNVSKTVLYDRLKQRGCFKQELAIHMDLDHQERYFTPRGSSQEREILSTVTVSTARWLQRKSHPLIPNRVAGDRSPRPLVHPDR